MSKGHIIVVSGASGVGKSTVLKKAMEIRDDLIFSVSVTTREPRPGEVDGVDYDFITQDKFNEMERNGEFAECDNHFMKSYGTPIAQLEEKLSRGNAVLDIDPNGAMQIRAKYPDATLIFIQPPSWTILEERLRSRHDTDEVQVRKRLDRARWECDQAPKYDYVVINDQVDACVEEVLKIIAEKAN